MCFLRGLTDLSWVPFCRLTEGRGSSWGRTWDGVYTRRLWLLAWRGIGEMAITGVVLPSALLAWGTIIGEFRWARLPGSRTGEGEWVSSISAGIGCGQRRWSRWLTAFAAGVRGGQSSLPSVDLSSGGKIIVLGVKNSHGKLSSVDTKETGCADCLQA